MDFIEFRKNKHEIIKEFPHDGDGSIKIKMNQNSCSRLSNPETWKLKIKYDFNLQYTTWMGLPTNHNNYNIYITQF